MTNTREFGFRLKFVRSPRDTLNVGTPRLVLPARGRSCPATLASADKTTSIQKSSTLILSAVGWPTAAVAEEEGIRYSDAVQLALVRLRIGVSLGMRGPRSYFTPAGLDMLRKASGGRIENEVPGLMIFETNPPPKFASSKASMVRGIPKGQFEQVFEAALDRELRISERQALSIELFGASFFQDLEDTRFLLLVMAIEALLAPARRSEAAIAHVDGLIHQTQQDSLLSKDEKQSLAGSLLSLKHESISHAGRRLAGGIPGRRTYAGRSAPRFFSHCYGLRSRMVHGEVPPPEMDEVRAVVADLEVFVSDLLSGPLLDVGPKD